MRRARIVLFLPMVLLLWPLSPLYAAEPLEGWVPYFGYCRELGSECSIVKNFDTWERDRGTITGTNESEQVVVGDVTFVKAYYYPVHEAPTTEEAKEKPQEKPKEKAKKPSKAEQARLEAEQADAMAKVQQFIQLGFIDHVYDDGKKSKITGRYSVLIFIDRPFYALKVNDRIGFQKTCEKAYRGKDVYFVDAYTGATVPRYPL